MMQHHVSLKPYNTFGIDVTANTFGVFQSVPELIALLQQAGSRTPFILGGGSNILLTKHVDGLV
ncbi:MAG TPA: hypothetical protein VM010_03355, partial [Chitinophagaceae bacterium]|nr:hypothetical protein [Chitinophagaceae bacterium]